MESSCLIQGGINRGPKGDLRSLVKQMCGFTGFWHPEASVSEESLRQLGTKMADRLRYRGPDDHGVWCDPAVGLVMAHRRLSIVDLSSLGHQPMISSSGRYVLVYNGEIYNAQELRQERIAEGGSFKSQTDTEVLLEGFDAWGVKKVLSKCIGMFAFALWDRETRTLTLGRDRLGIKPLYYGFQGKTLFFGSQLRSFLPHPAWEGTLDRQALASYFYYSYVPSPQSIYQGISKLKPGSFLEIQQGKEGEEISYWDLEETVKNSLANPLRRTEEDHIADLENLLKDSVGRRMVADVPLGAFLSGGIDSSLVVALMQAQSERPIKTFSIGFNEKDFDESHYAKKVAHHLGTDHHELYVTPAQSQEVIPSLSDFYDEPFADSSQIPTYLVSKMAREQVTVALSGDGGDELFGGYARYFLGKKMWHRLQRLPRGARPVISKFATAFTPETWTKIGNYLPTSYFSNQLGDKIQKGVAFLDSGSQEDFYASLCSSWESSSAAAWEVVQGAQPLNSAPFTDLPLSFVGKMQLADTKFYLPGDILTKVDRASMAVSLEARVPLLDHRLFERAWQLPESIKIKEGQGKWILRQILKKYLPEPLFERPKRGFGVPIGNWMRTDLRDWCESLLSQEALASSGILNPEPIRQLWQEHLDQTYNRQYSLWNVLMFQMWHQSLKRETS